MKPGRSLSAKLPFGVIAVVVLFVLGGGGLVTGASGAGRGSGDDGEGKCTLASLKGPYAYHVTGAVQTPSGADADVAAAGLAVSDGKGHVTGHDWASLNGATTPRTVTATYTVASDCTGTAHIVFTPGGAANTFFVLADGGQSLKLIQTDSGTVISGDAEHQ